MYHATSFSLFPNWHAGTAAVGGASRALTPAKRAKAIAAAQAAALRNLTAHENRVTYNIAAAVQKHAQDILSASGSSAAAAATGRGQFVSSARRPTAKDVPVVIAQALQRFKANPPSSLIRAVPNLHIFANNLFPELKMSAIKPSSDIGSAGGGGPRGGGAGGPHGGGGELSRAGTTGGASSGGVGAGCLPAISSASAAGKRALEAAAQRSGAGIASASTASGAAAQKRARPGSGEATLPSGRRSEHTLDPNTRRQIKAVREAAASDAEGDADEADDDAADGDGVRDEDGGAGGAKTSSRYNHRGGYDSNRAAESNAGRRSRAVRGIASAIEVANAGAVVSATEAEYRTHNATLANFVSEMQFMGKKFADLSADEAAKYAELKKNVDVAAAAVIDVSDAARRAAASSAASEPEPKRKRGALHRASRVDVEPGEDAASEGGSVGGGDAHEDDEAESGQPLSTGGAGSEGASDAGGSTDEDDRTDKGFKRCTFGPKGGKCRTCSLGGDHKCRKVRAASRGAAQTVEKSKGGRRRNR